MGVFQLRWFKALEAIPGYTITSIRHQYQNWLYIAENNILAADRFLDILQERFVLLAGQPLLGRARPELAPNLRSLRIGNYVIFYRPIDDGIEVARVLHGACDIEVIFEG
jgi:toxin ParE1/3/4